MQPNHIGGNYSMDATSQLFSWFLSLLGLCKLFPAATLSQPFSAFCQIQYLFGWKSIVFSSLSFSIYLNLHFQWFSSIFIISYDMEKILERLTECFQLIIDAGFVFLALDCLIFTSCFRCWQLFSHPFGVIKSYYPVRGPIFLICSRRYVCAKFRHWSYW